MKRLWLLAILLVLSCFITEAETQIIEVGEDRLVSLENQTFQMVEPFLAINPKNYNNLIVATMVVKNNDLSKIDCAVYVSFDGGQTWKRRDFGFDSAGDVWLEFLSDGTAVLSTLALNKEDDVELLVFRSTDGGNTWAEKPVSLGVGHDHPILIADRTSKKFAESVYTLSGRGWKNKDGKNRSSVFVARSVDGGKSFSEPTHVIANNLAYEAHSSVVLSDGTLAIAFANYRRLGDRRRLERQQDWLISSTDGGKTFSEPLFISESCRGAGGWSSLTVSPAQTAFPDRLYHLCTTNQFLGIEVRHSNDKGESWSDAVRVNNFGKIEPYTRTPAMAVNKNGILGIVWYDGRNDPGTIKGIFRCQEIYFTASLDGGNTFLPEVKVSSQKSCPVSNQDSRVSLRFPAGGEYIGMVAAPDGKFHLLWADNRIGIYQLRTSIIEVKK